MTHINHSRIIALLLGMVCVLGLQAAKKDEITRLEADMLKYLSTNDRDTFIKITDKLKSASHENGEERLYYTAWSNQAVFEATHQYYQQAFEIADQMMEEAEREGSNFGMYMAVHTKGVILLQKQDYQAAEQTFLKAADARHKFFPDESAGDDLQELMKIANHRKDAKAGVEYARQILAEPNVAPIHKGRALYRLSQMAFNKNNVDEFNKIYDQMMQLKKTDGIGTVEPVVEVNYNIVNGHYEEALRLADQLSPESRAERKAIIYHRMGNDALAYEYMQKFKKISDSITLVSHGNVVASCYVQMNNERMRLEQSLLERQNAKLRTNLYLTIAIAFIVILGLMIYQRQKTVKVLKNDNKKLEDQKIEAEKALDIKNEFLTNITKELRAPLSPITGFTDILGGDYELDPAEKETMRTYIKENSHVLSQMIDEMAEFSFFESKNSLPLTSSVMPSVLCGHMAATIELQCKPGVKMKLETDELPEDLSIMTNLDALEKLMTRLLNNSLRFTDKGTITLGCKKMGTFVWFSITDTGKPINSGNTDHVFDVFSSMDNESRYVGMTFNICQSIARLLHGRVWLDEGYNQGARFCFEVPIEPEEETTEEA